VSELILASAAETERLGAALAARLLPGDFIAFYGDLGAGKTTLARGLLAALGHEGDVASPTFPIVQPYDELDPPVWHVDLYRIESEAELAELALDEALEHAALLVEWPERMGSALPANALALRLERRGEGVRALTASVPPAWAGRWPPNLTDA
jgi:tRNA threonylcarbamoyladenosine biosynthesis protein TsaE